MNIKNYITYDVAKLLAEKVNSNIIGNHYYYNGEFVDSDDVSPTVNDEMIQAPKLSDVQDWLREYHKVYVYSTPSCARNNEGVYYWTYQILNIKNDESINESYIDCIESYFDEGIFDTYEDALNNGIKKTLLKYLIK